MPSASAVTAALVDVLNAGLGRGAGPAGHRVSLAGDLRSQTVTLATVVNIMMAVKRSFDDIPRSAAQGVRRNFQNRIRGIFSKRSATGITSFGQGDLRSICDAIFDVQLNSDHEQLLYRAVDGILQEGSCDKRGKKHAAAAQAEVRDATERLSSEADQVLAAVSSRSATAATATAAASEMSQAMVALQTEVEQLKKRLREVQRCSKRALEKQLVLTYDLQEANARVRALGESLNWRKGNHISKYGGYVMALARKRGLVSREQVVTLCAGLKERGGFKSKHIASAYEAKAVAAQRLRSIAFYSKMPRCIVLADHAAPRGLFAAPDLPELAHLPDWILRVELEAGRFSSIHTAYGGDCTAQRAWQKNAEGGADPMSGLIKNVTTFLFSTF